jgi:hypothetical protein
VSLTRPETAIADKEQRLEHLQVDESKDICSFFEISYGDLGK